MENFSEKKRGRPPIIDKDLDKLLPVLFPDINNRRTYLNHYYMIKAIAILQRNNLEMTECEYLFGDPKGNPDNMKFKKTILTELGRFGDPDIIRECALHICRERMNTKTAVQRLRNVRAGKKNHSANSKLLASRLIKTINDFMEQYPDTPDIEIDRALLMIEKP